MRKFVTLNEYIASLQKIAQTHGNDEVISLGSCTGTFDGLQSPRSIHLMSNGKEETFYVPCYSEKEPSNDSPYFKGRVQIAGGTFRFTMRRYDVPSDFGIDCGRISKLTVLNERTEKEIINYDRGWDICPKTKQAQAVLDWILRNYN